MIWISNFNVNFIKKCVDSHFYFSQKIDELVNIQLPVLGDKIYKAIIGIINGFKNLGRNPMSSIAKIGVGVFQ
jgi:hypothetical protein